MALTPANEDAFFREVDDELRRAQLQTVWQRYGRTIVAAVVVALLALAAFLYWQHRQRLAVEAQAETLSTAVQDLSEGKEKPARAKLATLTPDKDAYGVAARLTEAGLAMSKDDAKGAAARFQTIADDASVAQPFRELATIRAVAAAFDTLPPQQVIDRLKPLATPGGPWFGSAGEMSAIAYLKLNKPAQAAPIFAALAKDKTVPETLRARAVRISGMLGVDSVAAIGAGQAGNAR